MKNLFILIVPLVFSLQQITYSQVPKSITNITTNKKGRVILNIDGNKTKNIESKLLKNIAYGNENLNLENIRSIPWGTKEGIDFDFKNKDLDGTLYFGLYLTNAKIPHIVYSSKTTAIKKGKCSVNIIKSLGNQYDIIDWQKNKKGTLGYKIADSQGNFIYEGKINFNGNGPFTTDKTIIEGPFVSCVTETEAIISFETNLETICSVNIDNKTITEEKPCMKHEIKIKDLKPGNEYQYQIVYGNWDYKSTFQTAPMQGSRKTFVFGYASDSRKGGGGAERNMFGVNAYIMKKIMALSSMIGISYFQFTGDLINGYNMDKGRQNLEYANWKKALEPFASTIPVYTGIGNHELLHYTFWYLKNYKTPIMIDKFPFDTESSEAVFASNMTNPINGPESEDDSKYDPDATSKDFPSYKENVYYYTYDNTAMIVLNSDYWYTPQLTQFPQTSGNLHGYIMDNQLEWFRKTIEKFENDNTIDHIFVTLHTPLFPNGGHSHDDMWYSGKNEPRPIIAGKPVENGIIERRDQLLDIMVNKSKKTVAVLCGDEHNYSRTIIDDTMIKYPASYSQKKLILTRSIVQITNGAAGAPYYAQENMPWKENVKIFTPQYTVNFFHINGQSVRLEAINPETLELIEEVNLK